MRLDAPTLARAWLAVAQASATRDDNAALSRTVALEEFPQGLRLVATDRFTLLTAWVPNLEVPLTRRRTPGLDEAPDRTVLAWDGDGRARSLLGYVLKIIRRDKIDAQPEGALEVRAEFDVRIPAGQNADQPLEGLEPRYVTLSVPDVERVYLDVVEAAYPAWRGLLLDHHAQDTKGIALSPDVITRVAGVGRWVEGPLVVQFGGTDGVARVEFPESEPFIEGLMMPRRWVLEGEDPNAGTDPLDEDPDEDDGTPTRHLSSVLGTMAADGITVEVTGTGPLADAIRNANPDVGAAAARADLLADAVRRVTSCQLASARDLARNLGVGQDQARRLLDELEANGVVGPAQHGRSRDVLVTPDQAPQVLAQMGLDG